jgi:Kef-type K+ transport system membrane component KefB
MNTFFFTGIMLFIAIYAGRFFKKIKLPVVTGYILIGFLLGNVPFLASHLTPYFSKIALFIDELAVGIIAFEMGTDFSIRELKDLEKKIIILTIIQITFTWFAIYLSLIYILHIPAAIAITIASIGNATAPDIVILVTREQNIKSKIVKYLKGIVTLDDFITGLIFIVMVTISRGLAEKHFSWGSVEVHLLKEFLLPIVLGFIFGILFALIAREFKGLRSLFTVTIAALFVAIGTAILFDIHIILLLIVMGIVFTNISSEKRIVHEVLSQIDAPLFITFLIVNGSALSFKLLWDSGLLGIVFILSRGTGKVVGSTIGAKVAKMNTILGERIGWALLPQSEISIYLSILARNTVPVYGDKIFAVSMSGIIFFEIIGAPLLRLMLSEHKKSSKHSIVSP